MPDETPDDEMLEIELLRRVAGADRAAFAELHSRFSGAVFTTAQRILNDESEAEDVMQEVFVQIWEKAPLYDARRGKPLAWALAQARNKAIDRIRSAVRRDRLREEAGQDAEAQAPANESRTSEVAAVSREDGARVRGAVEQLNADQREAIELAFFRGKTQSEIAEELDQPLGTIKARIRRGMIRLRGMIDAEEGL